MNTRNILRSPQIIILPRRDSPQSVESLNSLLLQKTVQCEETEKEIDVKKEEIDMEKQISTTEEDFTQQALELIELGNEIEETKKDLKVGEANKTEDLFKDLSKYKRTIQLEQELYNKIELSYLGIGDIQKSFEKCCEFLEDEKKVINDKYNEVLLRIMGLEEQKNRQDIQIYMERAKQREKIFNQRKRDLTERMKEGSVNLKLISEVLNYQEQRQLEEWTQLKIGSVIFDTKTNRWRENSSDFSSAVCKKKNLLIIIVDTQHNKFGGFIKSRINSECGWIQDNEAFLFTLYLEGKQQKMSKYGIKHENMEGALLIKPVHSSLLFSFGDPKAISVYKENSKNDSFVTNSSFDFGGQRNVLNGDENVTPFVPQRILVIKFN